MANINLRAWRDERRQERQKQFNVTLLIVAILGGVCVFVLHQAVQSRIDYQHKRNNFLETEIQVLDRQIAEIRTIRQERDELAERMEVIQRLQGDRPIIVHTFDELVKLVPEGIYFYQLVNRGGQLSIVGVADKTQSISDLLRNLDASGWFSEPLLGDVSAIKDSSGQTISSRFTLVVRQATPEQNLSGASN